MMQRLHGSDAIFLYRETSTSLMHTMKVLLLSKADASVGYDYIYEGLKEHLSADAVVRKRVLPVPFGIHHPVLVDDPDFDVSAHVFHAAIPAPGTMRELDKMVAQIGSTLLDRSRPLWEIWVLEGLENGQVAIVQKIHHAMADGKAYLGYLTEGWEETRHTRTPLPQAAPLPSASRILWEASLDHLKHDIWNIFPIMKSFIGNLLEIQRRHKASTEPRINPLTAEFPRTRFNYALGVKRGFATCQLSLPGLKALKDELGVTLNDVVLAVMAGALRSYFIAHDELPDGPLSTSVPVGADAPGVVRRMGNNVTTLFTMLHVEVADPLERLYAIKKQTEQGKEDLEVFGKHQWGDLMEYVPPGFMTWSCRRNFRRKPANAADFKPNCNLAISNVPGPREKLVTDEAGLEALYSAGVLGEGMGLNITVWSYTDQLNVGVLACNKAIPDIERLTDAIPAAMAELQQAASKRAQ
jgi:diacylglycerol O-acyltransferase / wax synthase